MSELKDVITAYRNLSFGDRVVFYSTVTNDVDVSEETLVQLFARILSAGISVRNRDISERSPLPSLEV